MTTIFFVRHGPTRENQEGRIQGQTPGTLLDRATEQYLSAVVPLLRQKNPTLLVSSDLERAIKTREILKNFLQMPGVKETVSPLLREKAMGYYEGMLWSEVPAVFAAQRGQSHFDFRPFGGESDEDVAQRVREGLRQFATRYPAERLCCVTHAGWLQQLVALADAHGILPDTWSNRTAIYEGGVGPIGQLTYFHPITIEAQVQDDSD